MLHRHPRIGDIDLAGEVLQRQGLRREIHRHRRFEPALGRRIAGLGIELERQLADLQSIGVAFDGREHQFCGKLAVAAGQRGVKAQRFAAGLLRRKQQLRRFELQLEVIHPDLDPAYIEIFDLAELSGVGLAGYLTEGLGVPAPALAADRARLEALKGPVLILLSKALHGRKVTLTPDPRLTLVGTYAEDRPPVHFEPLPTTAAKGILTPGLPSNLTPQSPTLAFLLLGLALALVAGVALWLALG